MLRTDAMVVTNKSGMPLVVREWLPPSACAVLSQITGEWEELHLRVGRACSVTVAGENRRVEFTFGRDEMDNLILKLCDGSLYAHRDSITRGYLTLAGGIRVGLCGQAHTERSDGKEEILGVRDIDALCIRFPHSLRRVGMELDERIRATFPCGTLIYSPPGVGKTTLIRALAHRFSCGPDALRVVVADSRRELDDGGFSSDAMISVLSGYPKGMDVEIATRSLNPQLIVCDEIGNEKEAKSLIEAANCGVPVVATAHGECLARLLRRPGFDLLHRYGVFGLYVGLSREKGAREYRYHLTPWEEAGCLD